jgi:hypothetical protein
MSHFLSVKVLYHRMLKYSIMTGCVLDGRGAGVEVLIGSRIVMSGFGAHPTPYPMCSEVLFQAVMQFFKFHFHFKPECDHTSPTSAKVKKTWIYTFTSTYAFLA